MDDLDDMDRRRWDAVDRRQWDGMDRRLLSALHERGTDPRVAAVARALSRSGEHGALWLAAGLTGAVADRERRGAWLRGTALTATAHLASMGVKRIARRPRPAHVTPLVRTAGRHSFPSSHATAATAAALAYGAAARGRSARAWSPRSPPRCACPGWSSASTTPRTWPRAPPWAP